MATQATLSKTKEKLVGMGQIAVAGAPERLKAILGSCIGLVIYHPRLKTGVMAHIVLPDSAGRQGAAGKFGDTAVPEMLALLAQRGTPAHGLIAKFAGGANMFGSTGPLQIGDANNDAVMQALASAGVRIAGQDVGGNKGRRIVFDSATGELTIECAGQPSRAL